MEIGRRKLGRLAILSYVSELINTIDVSEYGEISCEMSYGGYLVYGKRSNENYRHICWISLDRNGVGIYAYAIGENIIEDISNPEIDWNEAVKKFMIKFLQSDDCSPLGG